MNSTLRICELIAPRCGIVAVVGSGGKSTLLAQAGRDLAAGGARVVLTTSTHMLPPKGVQLIHDVSEIDNALAHGGIVTIGEQDTTGDVAGVDAAVNKLSAPACGIGELPSHAEYVLVEADGSKCLPLKAHATWEPVVPPETAQTLLMVGASGFGLPIAQAVHRPEIFCGLTGARTDEAATPDLVARAIAAEGLVGEGDLVVVNQADGGYGRRMEDARAFARELGERIPVAVYAGSVRSGRLWRV